MGEEVSTVVTGPQAEVFRQQYELHNRWSQFYHDCEIKINTSAVWVSVVTALVASLGSERTIFPRFYTFLLAGAILIAASCTAFISSLGYWRYYEETDIFARECRKLFIDPELFSIVKNQTKRRLESDHALLNMIGYNAHHWVWFGTQAIFMIIGMGFLFAAGANR